MSNIIDQAKKIVEANGFSDSACSVHCERHAELRCSCRARR
jgi:hypothetical protein